MSWRQQIRRSSGNCAANIMHKRRHICMHMYDVQCQLRTVGNSVSISPAFRQTFPPVSFGSNRPCMCVCVCVCARFQSQVIVPCQCMFQPTGNGGRRFQHNCCTHCSGASVVACTYVSVCVDVSVDWHRQMSIQVVVRFIIVAVAVCHTQLISIGQNGDWAYRRSE